MHFLADVTCTELCRSPDLSQPRNQRPGEGEEQRDDSQATQPTYLLARTRHPTLLSICIEATVPARIW